MTAATTTEIRFTVWGTPKPRGSKRASLIPKRGGGWVEKNGRPIVVARDDCVTSKDWMHEVAEAALDAMEGRELITGALILDAEFFFTRPKSHYGSGRNAERLKDSAPVRHTQRPDRDKCLRAVCDALKGIVYRDDSQIDSGGTWKAWTQGAAHAVITIHCLEGADLC